MKKILSSHITALAAFAVFILLGLACGSTQGAAKTTASGQPKLSSAEEYWNRGQTHYRNNNFELAIEDFSAVIRLDPYYAPAHNEAVGKVPNAPIKEI